MKPDPANPFIFGQVLGPGVPFCPRPQLERSLRETVGNRQRLVLLGDRRMGKTSLVEHTLAEGDSLLVSVDLLGLASVEDFMDRVLARLERVLSGRRPLTKHLPPAMKEALAAVSSLRVDLPFVQIEAKPTRASTVMQVMGLLARVSEWKPLTVFFDEFQEIVDRLEEKPAQHLLGVLRGEIQRHDRITYLFAGSAKDSLTDIFTASQSPFYQSARILEVGALPRADMAQFLADQFEKGGRTLDESVLAALFSLAGDNPNELQQLAYHLWARSAPGPIGLAELRAAVSTLMAEIGRSGERVLGGATPSQRRMLFALSLCEGELEIFGSEFLGLAGFKTHQSADQAIKPFLKGPTAVLEKQGSKVRFRERFMRLWVLARVLRNPRVLPTGTSREGQWVQLVRPHLAGLLQ
ncbi:MAG TPA: hypothetical protein VGM73_10820 [Candidatus Didemnitutus sp.]